MPNASICNKKPNSDGVAQADEFKSYVLAYDNKTVVNFSYPKGENFQCYSAKPGPGPDPNQPPKPTNKDTNVGVACKESNDCASSAGDDQKNYCCGFAKGGHLVKPDGSVDNSSSTVNASICGLRTPTDGLNYQSGFTGPDGT